jgi:hypothetical protein
VSMELTAVLHSRELDEMMLLTLYDAWRPTEGMWEMLNEKNYRILYDNY